MSHNDQKDDLKEVRVPEGGKSKCVGISVAILFFLCLATVVFLISEHQARKSLIGFPHFASSTFVLTDQNGKIRKNEDFAGRPIALFLGLLIARMFAQLH